jgi:hypothetical protein
MTAAAHRGEQTMGGGEVHRAPYIGGAQAAYYERRTEIEIRVPKPPRRVIGRVTCADEFAAHAGAQVLDVAGAERHLPPIESLCGDVRAARARTCAAERK